MAVDLLSLDAGFEGLPYCDNGPTDNTSLDYTFEGQPFAPEGGAASPSSDAVVATSQGQQASASVFMVSNGVGVIATKQGQQAAGTATVAAAATVVTSQAQRTVVLTPVDSAVAASQAQSTSSSAVLSWNVTATTGQAQQASAQGAAKTPWQLVSSTHNDSRDGSYSFAPFALAAGNHVVISVQASAYTNKADGTSDGSLDRAWTLAVTDTAGNTYVALPPVRDQVIIGYPQYPVAWVHQFYCVNALGNASNVVTVTPVSGPPDAYSSAAPTLISNATVLSSNGDAAEFDTAATAASPDNSTGSLSLPSRTVQPGASVVYDVITNGTSPGETATGGWTQADLVLNAWRTYWRANNQVATQTGTFSGSGGIRLLSAVSLRAASGITATTRQGQTSSASAALIITSVNGSASTSQGQQIAASAGTAADMAIATAQAQRTAASTGATLQAAASTAQAQSANAQAGAFQPAMSGTAQGQTSTAQAGVSTTADVAGQQAQAVTGEIGTSLDGIVQLAQVQASTGTLDSNVGATVATSGAQQATGTLSSAYVLDVATAQEQQSDAVAGVASAVQGATAQAQASSTAAEVAVDAGAATRQAQRVRGQARAESANESESGQVQHVAGTLGLSSDVPTATRQGQVAALLAGVAVDTSVEMGQAQHIGDGNVLIVGVDAVAATAQEQQHAAAVLEQYQARAGTLSLETKRLHAALAGTAQGKPALEAVIRVRPATGGRADLRPER